MKYSREYKSILRSLRAMVPVRICKASAPAIPVVPGLYLFEDHLQTNPAVIYVGETDNLRSRLTAYHLSGDKSSARVKHRLVESGTCADLPIARSYIEKNCWARFVVVPNPDLRLFAEHMLIAFYTPKFNR